MPTKVANESDDIDPENKNGKYGYICINCGMGWDGKYIDSLNDKSCPDCRGELEFQENIDEI
jgi:DNA-directed RNA polymerase subunit RPC12/RpoP